jgi:opioid growth factor receptor-like protein
MSRILEFYAETASDHRGRSLQQLQVQSLPALESTHDYIQWLFPLPERSGASVHAPILTPADIAAFRTSDALRARLVQSLAVMLRFYGLESTGTAAGIEIRCSPSFLERSEVWLTPFNHNFLRLTRILRSLSLLGCGVHAKSLFACLEEIYRQHRDIVGEETFEYWSRAIVA